MAIPIPDAALDKHVALLGMTGAGKTSVIKTAIVEPDLDADRRVLIITPKDDWWGLRLSKTGKSAGFDIPIFGGRHTDYPLQTKDAALLAEAYGTMKGSAILCTSLLSSQDRARWFAAFAEKLLTANRGWLRVVIDEAHVFVPKQGAKGGGAVPMALHAGNELVSQGRSGGLRIVLASQRSAKLHNDALTQCSCLMAMMLMAPHDRDAVKDWIEDQADPQTGKEIIASLANLNPGQAWVWAPRAKFLECVQFARPSTFDSSDPDADLGPEHQLKPVNLDALKGKLAAVEAEVKAKDPKRIPVLESEVARLTAELANAPKETDPQHIEDAKRQGYSIGAADTRRQYENVIAILLQQEHDAIAKIQQQIGRIETETEALRKFAPDNAAHMMPAETTGRAIVARREASLAEMAQRRQANGGILPRPKTGTLPGPEQRILDSIAWWHNIGKRSPTNAQVAWLAGYSPNGGAYKNPRGSLKTKELITYPETDCLSLTSAGARVATPIELTTPLSSFVLGKIAGPERRILAAVIAAYPKAMSNADAAAKAGYSADGGAYKNPRGALRTKSLIDYPQADHLRAADWLFAR